MHFKYCYKITNLLSIYAVLKQAEEIFWIDIFFYRKQIYDLEWGLWEIQRKYECKYATWGIYFFMANTFRKTPISTTQAASTKDHENTTFASKLLFPNRKKIVSGQNSTSLQHFLSLKSTAWFYATEVVTFTPKAQNNFDKWEIWILKGQNN